MRYRLSSRLAAAIVFLDAGLLPRTILRIAFAASLLIMIIPSSFHCIVYHTYYAGYP